MPLDNLFDIEAPGVGATHRNLSEFEARQSALYAEKTAHDVYDRALRKVTQPEVKALIEELREELRKEEAAHARQVEAIIAKLPPSAKVDTEDEDDTSMRMEY